MADTHLENQDEKPLDPASEKLRRRMIRLMVISIGSMFIGIFAVLFGIVYKMNNVAAVAPVALSIDLPDGFNVQETTSDDGLIMFRGQTTSGERSVLMFDVQTGAPRGTIKLR